jgi:hypothetical protein
MYTTNRFTMCNLSIMMIKSGRMNWAGHAIHTWQKKNSYSILLGKPNVKRLLERHVQIAG